jgi:hypothetical protein
MKMKKKIKFPVIGHGVGDDIIVLDENNYIPELDEVVEILNLHPQLTKALRSALSIIDHSQPDCTEEWQYAMVAKQVSQIKKVLRKAEGMIG